MLIVVKTAQQQRRTPFHHPQRLRGLRWHGGRVERQVHAGIDKVVVRLVHLGQATVEIVLQQLRHAGRKAVVFAIADRATVGVAQTGKQVDLVKRLEL